MRSGPVRDVWVYDKMSKLPIRNGRPNTTIRQSQILGVFQIPKVPRNQTLQRTQTSPHPGELRSQSHPMLEMPPLSQISLFSHQGF